MIKTIFSPVLLAGFLLVLASPPVHAQAQYPGFGDPGARAAGAKGQSGADGLVPVVPTVDGGTIPTGSSAQVVIRFRNDGSQPVETGLIRLYPSSNVTADISLNQCQDGDLPMGAECAVAISVKGLQAGSWRVEMLMSHSGRSRLVSATASGSVEAGAEGSEKLANDVEAIPAEIDFGSLTQSQTLIQSVVIRNITSSPIDIEDVSLDIGEQSGYSIKSECSKLEAGQACPIVVSWGPKLKGRSTGVITVRHSGPTGVASIKLAGDYAPDDIEQAQIFPQAVPGKGLLVASQREMNFGADISTASTMTVSLVNVGDAPLTLRDIAISGSDNGLSFRGDGCKAGIVLQPIQACALTLLWSPVRVGPLYDDVKVSHDGARGVLVIPVRGTATAAVSQNQKAMVLAGPESFLFESMDGELQLDNAPASAPASSRTPKDVMVDASSTLDGFKITSFSPTRAIISGPGGSRLIFDNEEVTLGGVPWLAAIQKNGIEFLYKGQRILLLFDRSLSTISAPAERTVTTTSAPATNTTSATQ